MKVLSVMMYFGRVDLSSNFQTEINTIRHSQNHPFAYIRCFFINDLYFIGDSVRIC